MTQPKYPNRTPVSSFGPELYSLLIKASRERVEVPFPTWKLGLRCQQRIHMLRAAMQREGHPQYIIVSRVRTSLLWGEKAGYPAVPSRKHRNSLLPFDRSVPAKLVLMPQDSEFNEIIKNAGIEIDILPLSADTIADSPPAAPAEAIPTLDDILNSIKELP